MKQEKSGVAGGIGGSDEMGKTEKLARMEKPEKKASTYAKASLDEEGHRGWSPKNCI